MNGLIYIPSFITKSEEQDLLFDIDNSFWSKDLSRRTQHYGYKYDYTRKKVDKDLYLGPLPNWLNDINKRVSEIAFQAQPDQVIINEYTPGQGIAPHIDCVPCFGSVVASLSLLSSIRMNFKRQQEEASLLLEPGSLLVLWGEARNEWTHSIDRTTYDVINGVNVPRLRRISLTFRTVLKEEE